MSDHGDSPCATRRPFSLERHASGPLHCGGSSAGRGGSALLRALALAACVTLALSCGPGAAGNAPGKVPITTASQAALRDYLKARDLTEKLRGNEGHDYFQSAVAHDPDFALAYLGLASTAPSTGDFFRAIHQAVQLVGRVSPGEACVIRAAEADSQSNPAAQLEQLTTLVNAYPEDERAHTMLGHLYFERHQWEAAIREYRRATEINPDFSPAYNQLGYAFRYLGRYAEAEKAFKRYAELIPDEPNPYDSYAELLMKVGRFDESIRLYQKALDLDPNFLSAYVGMGNDCMLLGRYDEARRCFTKQRFIARTDNERAKSHVWAAISYLHQGELEPGLAELGKAQDIAAKAQDAFAQAGTLDLMGQVLLEAGRADDAANRFAQALAVLEHSSATPEAKAATRRRDLLNRARVALGRSELAEVDALVAEYGRAVAVNQVPSELRQAHEIAGLLDLAKGKAEDAVTELTQADQDDPRVLFNLGLAYEGTGRLAEAREAFAKAADFNGLSFTYAAVRARALAKLSERPAPSALH